MSEKDTISVHKDKEDWDKKADLGKFLETLSEERNIDVDKILESDKERGLKERNGFCGDKE